MASGMAGTFPGLKVIGSPVTGAIECLQPHSVFKLQVTASNGNSFTQQTPVMAEVQKPLCFLLLPSTVTGIMPVT
jgi:hypothetical protein